MRFDLFVIGSGPAGLAVARAASARGARTACIDPAPTSPWPRTFGVWSPELSRLADAPVIDRVWTRPRVHTAGRSRTLPIGYARLDAEAWQRALLEDAARRGVTFFEGRVRAVEGVASRHRVVSDDGTEHLADLVVDCSGHPGPWIRRVEGGPLAHQTAYGRLIEVDAHPFSADEMTFMDFRPIGSEAASDTFLYAMPLGPDRLFVEETSLCARPPVRFDVLERRLAARLRGLGIEPRRTLAEERCSIPLGVPLPARGQSVVAFGAAAGMVHPATGYQLARTLALAPELAGALVGPGDARARAHRAAEVVWPAARRRTWALFTYGMEAMLRLRADELAAFFDSFFDLPQSQWLSFLMGTSSPSDVARLMLGMIWRLEGSTRRSVLRLGPGEERALRDALLPRFS